MICPDCDLRFCIICFEMRNDTSRGKKETRREIGLLLVALEKFLKATWIYFVLLYIMLSNNKWYFSHVQMFREIDEDF